MVRRTCGRWCVGARELQTQPAYESLRPDDCKALVTLECDERSGQLATVLGQKIRDPVDAHLSAFYESHDVFVVYPTIVCRPVTYGLIASINLFISVAVESGE
jgi:hypothetical protein